VIWQLLGAIVVIMLLLCSPPVVRWLSQPTPSPIPECLPRGLTIATAQAPADSSLRLPVGAEASGRLVMLRATSPTQAVFALRHSFVSTDMGLPIGYPLVGTAELAEGTARATVQVPRATAVLTGAAILLALGIMLSVALLQPSSWNVVVAVYGVALILSAGTRAWRGIKEIGPDAVMVLQALCRAPRS
jgi:hypothetical protein